MELELCPLLKEKCQDYTRPLKVQLKNSAKMKMSYHTTR